MRHGCFTGSQRQWPLALALWLLAAGAGLAEENNADLWALYQAQSKQLAALKEAMARRAPPSPTADAGMDEETVKRLIGSYLKDNPGAGMPSGVQTGYVLGQGFRIASAPSPPYANWDDDSRIPFELRFRARAMIGYMGYKVTDRTNHQTNVLAGANVNAPNRLADFSQLELKRLNLVWQGSAFDPDLHFNINLLGSTRGLPGLQNNKVVQAVAGSTAPNGAASSPIGGGILLDHAVTLFEAYIFYDFHGCASEKGCGPDCPEGRYKYSPTYTLIGGKLKPFFGLDEFLGNGNQQFCDYSMADFFFDADDDTRLMGVGVQVKALEDRFFLQAIVTNGAEGPLQPNSQMDNLPGFICGFWYDLGGTWNETKKAWDLYGDCLSDVDYSCHPVIRAGGSVDLVPMNRRSLYGDAEQSRFFVLPAGPGGTRLINELSGDGAAATPLGAHAVDGFDAYTFNAFVAGKYRGFSFCNEWWVRDLTHFRTTPNGRGNIIYVSNFGNSLFPGGSLVDYGTTLQAGYFLIPKKLEVAARWSWVNGESGDINGQGTSRTITVPGVTGPVRVVNGAFRQYHEANEYTLGVNYFFKRHALKWQTDFGVYEGGNPAATNAPVAGWVAGSDGYLFRTQIQLAF